MDLKGSQRYPAPRRGFTVFEVVVSLAISALVIACLIQGFLQSADNAESSAYVLAAQARAVEGLEQVRAAKWDPNANPPVDEVVDTNFPPAFAALDLPEPGAVVTYATNYTKIRVVSTNPPLKLISVETVWRSYKSRLMTNSIHTYRAPDQ